MNKSLKTAERSQSEQVDRQPKQSSKSAVRKPAQLWITSTEMKTNFSTTETGSERANQQREKTHESAVRRTNPATISPVMRENSQVEERSGQRWLNQISDANARTTGSVHCVGSKDRSMTLCSSSANEHQGHPQPNSGSSRKSLKQGNAMNTALDTLKTGSVHGDGESRWSMALRSCSADERQGHNQINLRQQAAADAEVRKVIQMKDQNTQTGGTRLGVKVQNIATLANSKPEHVRAVGDLKVGRFVFKGVTFSREDGKEAVVKLPWETQMVSIPDSDDLTKVNQEVRGQISQALDGLKQVTASTGLWS